VRWTREGGLDCGEGEFLLARSEASISRTFSNRWQAMWGGDRLGTASSPLTIIKYDCSTKRSQEDNVLAALGYNGKEVVCGQ
jgi:hypothetical protein